MFGLIGQYIHAGKWLCLAAEGLKVSPHGSLQEAGRAVGERQTCRRDEEGVALIAVLGVIAVAMVMAAHLTLVSELSARDAYVVSERSRLKYIAESAADRALWLHMVDRRLFPNRVLGKADSARDDSDWEEWMLDGRPHEIDADDAVCTVVPSDADVGMDFTDKGPEEMLRNRGDIEDEELREKTDRFLDVFGDYTDSDDLVKLHGKEIDDYAAEGYNAMPRNDDMQFREEVYWLEDWQEILFGRVRIIPPAGIKFPSSKGKNQPPFFSSSEGMIREVGDFTDIELEQVLAAREQWQSEHTPLDESLPGDILGRIRTRFSFTESPVATIVVRATSKDGRASREFRVTRFVDTGRPEAYNDSQKQTWALWERLVF